jgi:hypothetical protein
MDSNPSQERPFLVVLSSLRIFGCLGKSTAIFRLGGRIFQRQMIAYAENRQ